MVGDLTGTAVVFLKFLRKGDDNAADLVASSPMVDATNGNEHSFPIEGPFTSGPAYIKAKVL